MGGRGSSSGKAGGSQRQQPTNAVQIENMNEAQIDKEIAKAERQIASAEKTMSKNDISNTSDAKAMRDAFPLGYGYRTAEQQRQLGRANDRDVKKAAAYSEAYDKKQALEKRLSSLRKAKQDVSGTDKTQKQIREERKKAQIESTPSTLKWKTTQKGGYTSNGGYAPKIIKAGSFEIRGESGLYSIFDGGKMIGRTSKLSEAKAAVERINSKR